MPAEADLTAPLACRYRPVVETRPVTTSSPRLRRGVVAVAGWLAAAFLATGVTLAAVTLIGSGIFGESTRTRSQAEVTQALAALRTAGASPSPSGTPSSPASSSPSGQPSNTTTPAEPTSEPTSSVATAVSPVRRVITSAGGTVLAECLGRHVTVISWTPAQGYRVDDVDMGARRDVEVRFEGEDTEVRVKIRCTNGRPDAEIEEDD
jgi:hypothetical protein